MKSRLFAFTSILLLCFSGCAIAQELETPISAQANIGGQIIDLEVAKTPEQMEKGLMYRRSLAKNRGMLFVLQYPLIPRFWMKNTLIPLDMIFLKQGRVQAILTDVPPCLKDPCTVYSPKVIVDKVIEISAGQAKTLAIKKGDPVYIHFFETAQKK